MNKIKERLNKLKTWTKENNWLDSKFNAVTEEIEFLENILPDLEKIFEGAAYFGTVDVSRGPADDKWIEWRKTLQKYCDEDLEDDYCEDE